MRLLRDSRGTPSWSVTLAIPALIAMTLRFVLGGLTLFGVTIPVWTANEYALAAGIWLAFFGQREYVSKSSKQEKRHAR